MCSMILIALCALRLLCFQIHDTFLEKMCIQKEYFFSSMFIRSNSLMFITHLVLIFLKILLWDNLLKSINCNINFFHSSIDFCFATNFKAALVNYTNLKLIQPLEKLFTYTSLDNLFIPNNAFALKSTLLSVLYPY